MASTGVSRYTGRLIRDFDDVEEKIEAVLTTALGERLIRPWFGFPGIRGLGETITYDHMLKMANMIFMALSMVQKNGLPAEPRFRIVQIIPIEATRTGEFHWRIEGEYLPRGHLGDFTVSGTRRILISGSGGRYSAIENTEIG